MATNAVATREPNAIVVFRRELESRANEIKAALPSHISGEKFQRTVTTAVMQNPDLLKADRRSLLLACMKAAQDGLLPDGREAALVTFSTRVKEDGNWVSKQIVQYMPMVYGLRKKVLQARNPEDGSPLVVALETGVVYRAEWEGGYFLYEVGTEPPLRHRVMLDIKDEEATDENIVAAYSIATMANGLKSYEVMRRIEIDKVRQVSQTGAIGRTVKFGADKGKEIPPKGPWVDWFAEMAKKTVVRRHTKTLPMSGDVLLESGTEAAEFEAASGSAALLASERPDDPQRIEDQGGAEGEETPHDRETGEVLERPAVEQWLKELEAEFAAAKTKKQKAAVHDKHAKRISDIEAAFPDLHARAKALIPLDDVPDKKGEPSAEGNAAAGQDAAAGAGGKSAPEASATPATAAHDAEPTPTLAAEIAERMEKAELVVDLDRIYDENEAAINDMDGDERGDLLRCYSLNLRRLGAREKATP